MDSQARCPYCGEPVVLDVDLSGGREQTYEEDCPVCCRPLTVHAWQVPKEAGTYTVALGREDD
jgi:hypothetical protein